MTALNRLSKAAVLPGVIFVLLVLAGIFVFFSVRTVDTKSVAVITLFGEVTGEESEEGLHFFQNPFCKFNILPLNLRTIDIKTSAFSTENQDVMCKLNVVYSLKLDKATDVFRDLGKTTSSWEPFISPIVENAFKELTIEYKITDIVAKREQLRRSTLELVASRMTEQGAFFNISRIEIVDMDYGEKYKEQIGERNKMTQQALQAEEQLKKEKMLAQIPVIQAEAKVAAARAEAEAMLVRAKAEAEAFKILSESVSFMIIWLRGVEKWNGVLPFGATNGKTEK